MTVISFGYLLFRFLFGQVIFETKLMTGTHQLNISRSGWYGIWIHRDFFNLKARCRVSLKDAHATPIKTYPTFLFARSLDGLYLYRYAKLDTQTYTLTTLGNPKQQRCQLKRTIPEYYFLIWLLGCGVFGGLGIYVMTLLAKVSCLFYNMQIL